MGLIYDPDGSPSSSSKYGVSFSSTAIKNSAYSTMVLSSPSAAIRHGGDYNFVQVSAHNSSLTSLVIIDAGKTKNVTDISHPGSRQSIVDGIVDNSSSGLTGTNANVTYCHATGEHLGSLSGTFYRTLATPAVTWGSTHMFRDESPANAIHAYGTPNTIGLIAGIQHSIPGDANLAGFWHQIGATVADNFWALRGWGTGAGYVWNSTGYRPNNDNAKTLGTSSYRWSVVYSGTGTINTSDAREKQCIRELSDSERAVAVRLKSLIRAFKFNDAVEAKGSQARIHVGVIAQDVKAAFESEGLIAEDYAIICYDEWNESSENILDENGEPTGELKIVPAGNRYGIRYDELLAFIISAL